MVAFESSDMIRQVFLTIPNVSYDNLISSLFIYGLDKTREEVVATQILRVTPSDQIMVGSCCYTSTFIGAWH
jgi:hypothetical protein